MSGARVLRREISFYSIQTVKGSGKKAQRDSGFAWAECLAALAADPNKLNGVREKIAPLRCAVPEGLAVPTVAIYRPLDSRFLSVGKNEGKSIQDLDMIEGFELMNASAFFFPPDPRGLVCILQGDPSSGSPSARALRDFATAAVPQEHGVRWTVQPIYVDSQLEELRRADGADRVRAKMRGRVGAIPFAEAGMSDWTGFPQIADYFAGRVGDDVEVTLTVKLPREIKSSKRARHGMREMVLNDAGPKVLGEAEVSVHASTVRGSQLDEETLTLARHAFASKIEIEVPEGEPVRFSALVEETARDLVENASRYAQLATGGQIDEPEAPIVQ